MPWPLEDNRIPREIFTDPDLFRTELDAVFTGPVWVLVGHEAELPNEGDYKTISVRSVPVIVVRGTQGRLSVLVNACAHCGTRLMGEYRDVVAIAGRTPHFRSKRVILDTPMLQDVFVYPL